ncbi:MAG: FadR family transcriptional regulator [Rhizobacter sp.]|nr:FadR family transcriptional regulator [Rhizobacter sp.]
MPLHTIESRRLYRQIADQLRALIARGEYPPGTRLPPERELAQQLGVSRPSVREALIALEVEGRVEVRMGSGVYVRQADDTAARQVSAEGPLETIRARQLIESELAAQAARCMKKAQIAGLREAIDMMEREAAAGQVPSQGDRLFHTRVAEASDNSVLLRVVCELFDERRNPLFEQLGSHFETASSWAAAIAEHRAVVDAIASKSASAARVAMAQHLSRSHDRFTANFSARPPVESAAKARQVATRRARTHHT